MAYLIKADGSIVLVEPKDGKQFSLEEIQSFVGGYIELVPVRPGRYGTVIVNRGDCMFCDEDGKRKTHFANMTASVISQYFPRDFVVGDVLICSRKQVN